MAPSQKPSPEDEDDSTQRLVCLSEAIIKVRKPSKLASLRGRVDRNVLYDARKGEFHLLMRHPVGEPSLGVLKSRIIAIDRFVCFLEALEKSKETIQSENISLRGVSFFYSDKQPDASASPQRWRVSLDLSKDEVDVHLGKGNPHLRVIDLMKRLVNLDGGIQALMSWLPTSLSTLMAIDTIETNWEDIQARTQGQVEISIQTLDHMGIRYTIMGTTDAGQPAKRQLILEARISMRQNEPWWIIKRSEKNPLQERFNTALQPVWSGRGKGWLGLSTSAAGKASGGAAELLQKVDEAVRGLVGNLNGDEGFVSARPAQAPQQQQQQSQQQKQKQKQKQERSQPKTGKGPEQAIEIA